MQTKTISDECRAGLENAIDGIRNEPKAYQQGNWGSRFDGAPSCNSPACVAGHIVAGSQSGPALYRAARYEMSRDGETDPSNLHAMATAEAATKTLGLTLIPMLFEGVWPVEWAQTVGISNPEMDGDAHFAPKPDDAVTVLNAVLDGKLPDALDMSDIMAMF